jgi:hypothetical protein
MSFLPSQLSYSVSSVQSEVAVRVGVAGTLEPKHEAHERAIRRKCLMKVEVQFLPYFFLLRQKSKINDFSNEEYVGSKIFPALDILSVPIAASGFVPFWRNLAKRFH